MLSKKILQTESRQEVTVETLKAVREVEARSHSLIGVAQLAPTSIPKGPPNAQCAEGIFHFTQISIQTFLMLITPLFIANSVHSDFNQILKCSKKYIFLKQGRKIGRKE